MRFKDFINEAVDIDPSKINLVDRDKYEFTFDGEYYSVDFSDTSLDSYGGEGVEIGFHGPNGCMPTGTSGSRASTLYGIMLSAVIAYIEKYKPKGLTFIGATSGMNLIYKRFADRYAGDAPGKPADRVFLRVDVSDWIRKDVYENLDPETKKEVDDLMAHWRIREPRFIEEERQALARRRQAYMKYQPYIGGFVYDAGTRIWHILYGVNQQGLVKVINTSFGALHQSTLYGSPMHDYRNMMFLLPSEIDKVPKDVIADFAQKISNAGRYSFALTKMTPEMITNIMNQNQRLGNETP